MRGSVRCTFDSAPRTSAIDTCPDKRGISQRNTICSEHTARMAGKRAAKPVSIPPPPHPPPHIPTLPSLPFATLPRTHARTHRSGKGRRRFHRRALPHGQVLLPQLLRQPRRGSQLRLAQDRGGVPLRAAVPHVAHGERRRRRQNRGGGDSLPPAAGVREPSAGAAGHGAAPAGHAGADGSSQVIDEREQGTSVGVGGGAGGVSVGRE